MDDKVKEALRIVLETFSPGITVAPAITVAHAYIDAEARARMAEFESEHGPSSMNCRKQTFKTIIPQLRDLPWGGGLATMPCDDERHDWDLTKWRAEVVKELEEK